MNEYEVLCDDGEEVTIYAETDLGAMWEAIERGYKPVEAVRVDDEQRH
jgi:hypothetical protein